MFYKKPLFGNISIILHVQDKWDMDLLQDFTNNGVDRVTYNFEKTDTDGSTSFLSIVDFITAKMMLPLLKYQDVVRLQVIISNYLFNNLRYSLDNISFKIFFDIVTKYYMVYYI